MVRSSFEANDCTAVNIYRTEVPSLVENGTEFVILDCQYNIPTVAPLGLVVKWFFNGTSGLVYQWIPPLKPQVIGLLKGKVDLNFKISEEPLQAYRAIKILKPSTDLSGMYTCVVSTFLEEDRQTRCMLIYSSGKNFQFTQEKKYVFLVTLICGAEDLYPKPEIIISARGKPLTPAVSEIKMNSWGLYSLITKVVVHDDDVFEPYEEYTCTLRLPLANYTANRTTVYYPGMMPTPDTTYEVFEIQRPQERLANGNILLSRNFQLQLIVALLSARQIITHPPI
ncbi:uncharacterized protein LOC123655864 [Melitaea cinxia]|uniref:uncharacterized protein LOC123655864 n=1 Tax=Melitaea cinxia TaxID=113334 RepID=UPI001E26F063|nr:uncharacterized protein LOC123655864 [Melitaea cinxia]